MPQRPIIALYDPHAALHIAAFGQSLAIGAYGYPALSTKGGDKSWMLGRVINPPEVAVLVRLVESSTIFPGYGETVIGGAVSQLTSSAGFRQSIVGSARGVPGTTIDDFIRGSRQYSLLMRDIAVARNLTHESGRGYTYRATVFLQGEEDERVGTAGDVYKKKLVNIAKSITEDTSGCGAHRVPFAVSQLSSHQFYRSYPTICIEQYKAAKEFPELICLIGPKYFLPYFNHLHLSNEGYLAHGCKVGQVLSVLLSGSQWFPLMPEMVALRRRREISVKFKVFRPPIVIDTKIVSDPNGQLGFEYIDDDGAANITDVEITGGKELKITLDRDSGPGALLRYAYTGVAGQPSGARHGPRGCLRDSDETLAYTDSGVAKYKMFNWCVHFEELVES